MTMPMPDLRTLLVPLLWIFEMQRILVEFFLYSSSPWVAAAKYVFLLFPVLLFVAAIWCTQISLYTILFRSERINFVQRILFAWWDAGRAALLYWVGLCRLVVVTIGWLFTLTRLGLRLVMETFRQLLLTPFTMTGRLSKSYFQPGVPWVAFLMLVFWCLLEATIFTHTLFPTVSEVLTDLVGMETPAMAGPVLFFFLLMLILGSFACLQVLLETVKRREYKFVIQMVVVELFVMFFEVMFLYRELVDAITPWIAQQAGERFRMGIGFTLSLATFGWAGIRGMTWFLFGQFGTPPLLAFISRRPLAQPEEYAAMETAGTEPVDWWRTPIEDFKSEIEWFHAKSEELLEYLTLPVLQVMAAALNFAMILLTARPVMSLPLTGLSALMRTRDLIGSPPPREQSEVLQPDQAQVGS